ncbi:MAG: hypothetical protein Tsb0015_14860 [Simkaniaceae bacterium]
MINFGNINVVISGSFRKHLDKIYQLKKILENLGLNVLSPQGCSAVNPEEEFVILDSDPINSPELLQSSVFAKIRCSTMLIVANFDGYLGSAAILEIGYAIAIGIKVFVLEEIQDPNIKPYVTKLSNLFPELEDFYVGERYGKRADKKICKTIGQ